MKTLHLFILIVHIGIVDIAAPSGIKDWGNAPVIDTCKALLSL